jgi:hypothetical protein
MEPKKLLLMGSSAYKIKDLPKELTEIIDEAISKDHMFIVGEAYGACRVFQDYLKFKNYSKVVVGHAKRIRYNAGNWVDKKFGDDLQEREKNMINYCDYAIIIWVNDSSVIARNLDLLKKLRKPTIIYEYSTHTRTGKFSTIDSKKKYS